MILGIAVPCLGGIGPPELIILSIICCFPVTLVVVVAILAASWRSTRAVPSVPAGWHPDPSGRHELRYWNGAAWTLEVSDGGVRSQDPT